MFVKSGKLIHHDSMVFTTIHGWISKGLENGGLSPQAKRLLKDNILIGFNKSDFVNENTYKGAIKLYKCNSVDPKFYKIHGGKGIGYIHILGFKVPDYDCTTHYLLASKMEFLYLLKGKMIEEFPEYPAELYLYDLQLEHPEWGIKFKYDRCWEHIKDLTPQEKIVLANLHGEEPFPNSFYENDNGIFSKRTQSDEIGFRVRTDVSHDVRDYEASEDEDAFDKMDKAIAESEASYISGVRENFDYGDFQEFSDIYTRTQTSVEDYELYPIRVNCLPKAVKKKGKSPYDTKLGVRQYIWHNMWAKPEPLENKKWVCNPVSAPTPTKIKYEWELSEKEKLEDEYDLPDNFWEEIEMAYQSR